MVHPSAAKTTKISTDMGSDKHQEIDLSWIQAGGEDLGKRNNMLGKGVLEGAETVLP